MTEKADPGMRPLRDTLSQLRLRELLVEVQDRVGQIVEGRDRLDGLVEAMLVVRPAAMAKLFERVDPDNVTTPPLLKIAPPRAKPRRQGSVTGGY